MLRTRLRALAALGNRTAALMCAALFVTAVFARPAHAQQAARIDTVTPSQADAGQAVTITGIGFGARNVRITVGGVAAPIVSATGSRATFIVPTRSEEPTSELQSRFGIS